MLKEFSPFFYKDYIARFGHGSAKLAKQAQSKEKVLAKMVSAGLTEKVVADKVWQSDYWLINGREGVWSVWELID